MHKHFQMIVKGNFRGLPMLNKKIKVCLGWDESPPTSHVVSCKRIKDDMEWTLHWMMCVSQYELPPPYMRSL